MNLFKYAFLLIVPLIFFKCTNPEIPLKETPTDEISYKSMRQLKPGNKLITMGTNEATAPLDERPAMSVSLTYDFYMDSVEVTQAEFNSLLLRNPVADSSKYGIGPNYPVYNVSWFDAILFCNARSKRDTLDTVYSYFEIKRGSNGSVYDLIGLSVNYNADGFRLPTEAEWEYCAGSDLKYDSLKTAAWFQENSLGKAHPVGTKTPNQFGIYDLIGNVFEWTNDWKNFHKAATLQNPLGARNPNHEFEKVIKGGSFKDGLQYLRTSCRATTYSTTASAAAEYIGFRCARGKIPNAKYVDIDTSVIVSSPVLLTYSDMSHLVGTTLAKVVFVNVSGANRRLCFVNYADVHPQVYEFTDRNDVYAPTISPDGRFVAFCTSDEGLRNVIGTVYIRSLEKPELPPVKLPVSEAYVPRWFINSEKNDTAIIYTNSVIDNNLPEWSSTATFGQIIHGGVPFGAPQKIISDGSYHDGLSPDGNFIVTGNSVLKMKYLSREKNIQLFTSKLTGKPSSESSQVCNVSMSPGMTYRGYSMFLDFGCIGCNSATNYIVKEPYQAHQYIFFCNTSGLPVKAIKHPPNEFCWENPEWTNQEQYAISASENKDGQNKNIYLINIIDNTYQQILTGSNLAQPYCWISDKKLSSDDSLGRYDLPLGYGSAVNSRMRGFWHHYNDMEIMFFGSSHTAMSVDTRFFSRQVYNMGISEGSYCGTKRLLFNYVKNHCPKLKMIGIDLFLKGFFAAIDPPPFETNVGYQYDKKHNFWVDSIPKNFLELIDKSPIDLKAAGFTDTMNVSDVDCEGWGTILDTVNSENDNSPNIQNNLSIIKEICDTFSIRKVHVLFYLTPESPIYSGTSRFGSIGPSKHLADSLITIIKSIVASNPYVHFYDAHINGKHDYTNDEAQDPTHLCPIGAAKFSTRLDSVMTTIFAPAILR